MEPLSTKNTKAEILEAYESLLKNVQTAKAEVPKQMQEEKQKKEIVNKVSDISGEKIISSISGLQITLENSFDELRQNLLDEFQKLENIRSAIAVEKQSLEDLYDLSSNTDSLAAMLLAQKEKKENFEKMMADERATFEHEMAEKKELWNIEKSKHQIEDKETADELVKRRKREEEEYSYNLKITRQKEQNDYDAKKSALEKELKEKKVAFEQEVVQREAELKNAETELAELRQNSLEFPAKLENALQAKEKEIIQSLQLKHDFEIKLMTKQNEADIRLKDQMVTSLQEKIKELQAQVKEYAEKSLRAENSVKDIAVKAIENASNVRVITQPEKEEK